MPADLAAVGPAPPADPMLPAPHRVQSRVAETRDSATLRLAPLGDPLPAFAPGQFAMLYARGIGEIAISVSRLPDEGGVVTHTIRDVGAVSHALHAARVGSVVGVRGPFGTSWDLTGAAGRDVVLVAGGVGLAPLRPALDAVLARRQDYRRLVLVAGARSPAEFLFDDELAAWSADPRVEVHQTIDQPATGWDGPIGFVTEPLARLRIDPDRTTALLCGPEPMMRFCASTLLHKGMPPAAIQVSLERAMKCGIGLCGHCQLGPLLVCRDGPVVDYGIASPLLAVQEL